jgi:DNA-binding PadR family transcriptional regulator
MVDPQFPYLAKIVGLTQHLRDAVALVCLAKEPLRYTDLGERMAEWSGWRVTASTLTRVVNRLRDAELIIPETTSDGGRSGPYILTTAGRARAAEIAAAIEAARTGGTHTDGPSGQDLDGDGSSMIGASKRPSRQGIRPPWEARRGSEDGEPLEDVDPRSAIDTSKPHPARRYNYLLGGKDHFAADRQSADEIEKIMPTVRLSALENRAFQRRSVQYLSEAGIRQFLDIGTGIPAPDNTHEIAQAVDPTAQVVYVDNDPVVLAHARALLTSHSLGRTAYLNADLRAPETILNHPDLRSTLDLDRPVGLLLIAVLHFITDEDDVFDIVGQLMRALAPGSFLVITHGTLDFFPPEQVGQTEAAIASGRHGSFRPRPGAAIRRFFSGLDLAEPGLVPISAWRPTETELPDPAHIGFYGGAGKVP